MFVKTHMCRAAPEAAPPTIGSAEFPGRDDVVC